MAIYPEFTVTTGTTEVFHMRGNDVSLEDVLFHRYERFRVAVEAGKVEADLPPASRCSRTWGDEAVWADGRLVAVSIPHEIPGGRFWLAVYAPDPVDGHMATGRLDDGGIHDATAPHRSRDDLAETIPDADTIILGLGPLKARELALAILGHDLVPNLSVVQEDRLEQAEARGPDEARRVEAEILGEIRHEAGED